jgi:hypothetical protein
MNKSLKFSLTIAWILFSRAYDAYSTAQLTPDLSKEANPLVTVVGISSWTTLIIVLGAITLYTLYVYYKQLFHPMNLLPKEKQKSFGDFVTFLYLGRSEHWSALLYKFPNDWKRFNAYMGEWLPPYLVYAGVVSTLMWLGIHYSEWYRQMHRASYIYAILIAGCLVIGYILNRKKYHAHLQAIS